MRKPTLITSDVIWEKLDSIEKRLNRPTERKFFEGLLINDITKDLKVSSEFVVKEWILTGKLKAINVGGSNRIRGGWRIKTDDYIEFLTSLKTNDEPEEETLIFIRTPQQIIDDFHKSRKQKAA